MLKSIKLKGLAWIALKEDEIKSPIAKFLSEDELNTIVEKTQAQTGDIILIVADKNKVVLQALGNLRNYLAQKLDLIDDSKLEFAWVVDFPLFGI